MAEKIFKDFDFSGFWDDDDYALREYVCEYPTDQLIHSIEEELGYKLPASYIELMKMHNGGMPVNTCFPAKQSTSWAPDHVAITGILGIGREKQYSLGGSLGSKFMIYEGGYPDIGICICDCPSAGHDMIMLNYSKCGKNGEPEVVHVDQESNYRITFLANNFETFIKGLVNEDVYDTSAKDLENSLIKIEKGKFSQVLSSLIQKQTDLNYEKILRSVCKQLAEAKGYFSLHADDLSCLVYDIQFFLYSSAHKIKNKADYLEIYPSMIALGDGEFSTGGYAPGFIEDWLESRISNKLITKKIWSGLRFTREYEEKLKQKLKQY